MAEEKPLDMPTMEVSQSVAITTSHCTSTKSTFSDIAKEIKPYDSGLVSSISGVNSLTKKSLADASKEIVNLKRPLVENNYVESKEQHLIEDKETKPKHTEVKPKICNEHSLSFKGKNKTSLDDNVDTYEEPGTSNVGSPKDDLNVPPSKIIKLNAYMGIRIDDKNDDQSHHQTTLPFVPNEESQSVSVQSVLPKSPQKIISNTINAVKQTYPPRRVLRSYSKSGSNSSGTPSRNTSPTIYEEQLVQSTSSPSMTTDAKTTNTLPTTHLKLTKNETAAIFKNSKMSVSMPSSSMPETSESILTANLSDLELHSKRRKIKANRTENKTDNLSFSNRLSDVNSHFFNSTSVPVHNNYKMFLDIRKEISKKHKNLFAVQPKPPPGFEDYLMNKRAYHLAGNSHDLFTSKLLTPPVELHEQLKSLFNEQEKERHNLRVQHVVQKEKLMLSVEQEILRVHGHAARELANQPLPFSACTFLKDKEVYSMPKKENENTNKTSRYNGRLFISWAQEMDDKWDKIMESMIVRHHNEAESLHAVQKMYWGWKLKELKLCSYSSEPYIDKSHVPVVYVADDFDLITT